MPVDFSMIFILEITKKLAKNVNFISQKKGRSLRNGPSYRL